MGDMRVYVGVGRMQNYRTVVLVTNENSIILDDKLQETKEGVCELFGKNSLQILPDELKLHADFGTVTLDGHKTGEYILRKKAVMTPEQFSMAKKALEEAIFRYDQNMDSIMDEYAPQLLKLQKALTDVESKMQGEKDSLGPKPELNEMILKILGLTKSDDD